MNLKEFGFTDINHELLQETNTPYKIYAELLLEIHLLYHPLLLNQKFITTKELS